MRPISLSIEGFESARNQVDIDYGDNRLIGFVGDNGAGKSMLAVWALYWLLFDKLRHRPRDKAISRGATGAWGQFVFEHGGTVYRIERHLPRTGKAVATLSTRREDGTWEPPKTELVKDANAEIVAKLGMDPSVAENTFFALQGKYGQFTEADPSVRRQVLTTIFGLTQYAEKLKVVKAEIEVVKTASVRLTSVLSQIAVQRDHLGDGNAFPDLSDVDLAAEHASRTAAIEAHQIARNDLDARERTAQEEVIRVGHAEKDRLARRARVEGQLTQITATGGRAKQAVDEATQYVQKCEMAVTAQFVLRPEIQKIAADLEEMVAGQASAKSTLASLEGDRRALVQRTEVVTVETAECSDRVAQLDRESGGLCFTCEQTLSVELLRRLRDEQADKIKAGQAELLRIKQSATEILAQTRMTDTQVRAADLEIRGITKTLQEHRNQLSAAEHLARELDAAFNAAASRKDDLIAARTARETIREELAEIDSAQTQVMSTYDPATFTTERAVLMESRPSGTAELEREVGRRSQRQNDAARLAGEEETATGDLDIIKARMLDLGALHVAFSPNGTPATVLADGVGEIADIANSYLEVLSHGTMSMAITTQRVTTTGTLSEEIFLDIDTPDGSMDYQELSGGQKFRVDLAVRIALTKVSASHSGAPMIETFVLDEGYGSLDTEGRADAVAVLSLLAQELTVLTVTHIDDVKSALPAVIEVSKDSGTTVASLVAV